MLANLLTGIGVKKGDVVAVMDWDSPRYLEHYFAVPMIGAVLHTVNIRLSPEQMLYTINHAEDKIVVVHKDFSQLIKALAPNFETVKKIIYIDLLIIKEDITIPGINIKKRKAKNLSFSFFK